LAISVQQQSQPALATDSAGLLVRSFRENFFELYVGDDLVIVFLNDFVMQGVVVDPAVLAAETGQFPAGHKVSLDVLHQLVHVSEFQQDNSAM
jgi:hypothetical protein